MKRLALAAMLLLAAAALAGVARPDGASAVEAPVSDDSVTVTGSGSVSSLPDRAELSFGVETRADSARAALAANAREMRKVIDAVRSAGARDVSTRSVSLSPVFADNSAIKGYAATNVATAIVTVDAAGSLIDAAVQAGANQVWGPSLSIADQSTLYLQALKAAVADAREKAQTLAVASGRSLGKVTVVSEGSGYTAMTSKLASAENGTPVVAGPQETTATVSVTFALA